MAQDDAIVRLARQIDAARKAECFLVNADEVARLRRHGACELHRICADFVSSVNSNLSEAALDLVPATYAPELFREPGQNLIQIGSQGRQMQIAFEAPSELVSTEKFLVPYVLEGEVRTYNQRMLERFGDSEPTAILLCGGGDRALALFRLAESSHGTGRSRVAGEPDETALLTMRVSSGVFFDEAQHDARVN